ncbi:Cobalamin 5''-phosphate synthase/cobalamin synthase [Neorhizobium galegae bv. officinalis]|uniref:Adenosylcobinamide-GDP ribazoletransferase n=1 Tax=Neorhizobium galegae bv. officinalis TaxID=323656 RepID=A0A0T7G203_NEOGA|nr:Cobalamin 5''-phosphate synthase/cobalamin synthase [Neorhizobium galegae bv. officinalis]
MCAQTHSRVETEEQLPNATECIADLARSVGFLSRVPVPDRFFRSHDGTISRAVRAFPVAGLIIAALPALVLLLLQSGDPLLVSLLSLAALTVLTGALHEDGLADAADGLGGGRDKDHALLIMKDSRIGAYGVVALVLSFGLRASALAALFRQDAVTAALAVLAVAAVSRAVMVAHWRALPSARESGVAAGAGFPEDGARNIALFTGAASALVLLVPVLGLPKVLLSLIVAALAGFGFTRFVRRKLGGHTGDTIGATQQLSEIAMLATLALAA